MTELCGKVSTLKYPLKSMDFLAGDASCSAVTIIPEEVVCSGGDDVGTDGAEGAVETVHGRDSSAGGDVCGALDSKTRAVPSRSVRPSGQTFEHPDRIAGYSASGSARRRVAPELETKRLNVLNQTERNVQSGGQAFVRRPTLFSVN